MLTWTEITALSKHIPEIKITGLNSKTIKDFFDGVTNKPNDSTAIILAWAMKIPYDKFYNLMPQKDLNYCITEGAEVFPELYALDCEIESVLLSMCKIDRQWLYNRHLYRILYSYISMREVGGGWIYSETDSNYDFNSSLTDVKVKEFFMPKIVRSLTYREKRAFRLELDALLIRLKGID
ncbi:hypothetical protein [Paenibacillus elgii]|uniref:hypothetical protein n=1 Tax=Paenibacillus elgii TaxID=189691 RepID=UPI00203B7FF8|nr:hypothetical protein [Paenibacillus elgii]MCM3273987.1 hypothetical protein [Paenibacillus elgii]